MARRRFTVTVWSLVLAIGLPLGAAAQGVVATPAFTPAPGTYAASQSIAIACATPGATIHFTTDGTTPTTSSPVYAGQAIAATLHVTGVAADPVSGDGYDPQTSASLVVKALAVAPGMTTSTVATGTYVIDRVDVTSNIAYAPPPDAGGSKHLLDVYRPVGSTGRPVVLFIHGGAWIQGDKDYYFEVGHTLAGYYNLVTVIANYELSADPWFAKHPGHVEDVAAALAWTIEHVADYGGDPQRVYLFGQSAGGQIVSLVATDGRYLDRVGLTRGDVKGVVAMSGAYDLYDLVRYPLNPAGLTEAEVVTYKALMDMAFDSWEQAVLDDGSPQTYVSASQPPFFVLDAWDDMPGFNYQASEFLAAARAVSTAGVEFYHLEQADMPQRMIDAALFGHVAEIAAINTRDWNSVSTVKVAGYVGRLEGDDDLDGLPSAWESQFGLDASSPDGSNGAEGDPDADGDTNAEELAAGTHPRGTESRYFAEGATSTSFSTQLALFNTDAAHPASVLLRYLKADGTVTSQVESVPARTRRTVDVGSVAGMATAEFSTTIESDRAVVADRTMRWDATAFGSHAETAVASPSTTWFLAEGTTVGDFQLFYLLQNPNATPAAATVRFLRPSGLPPLTKAYDLPPHSRVNIWVNVEEFDGAVALAHTDVSAEITTDAPIIAERAVYLSRPGQTFAAGHESMGVTAPALEWFFAEGATGPYFDLFVLVANPSSTDAEVDAVYRLPDGTTFSRRQTIGANSRFNIWVDYEDDRLADTAVSTTIRSMNGVPVIAERALWWPGGIGEWYEAHNSPGATTTATRWAIAEGEVGGALGMETYILLANTSADAGTVKVTLYFEDGTSVERTFAVAASSRFNVEVSSAYHAAQGRRFGAIVESVGATPVPLVVERAMYWSAQGQNWAAGTNALATRLP